MGPRRTAEGTARCLRMREGGGGTSRGSPLCSCCGLCVRGPRCCQDPRPSYMRGGLCHRFGATCRPHSCVRGHRGGGVRIGGVPFGCCPGLRSSFVQPLLHAPFTDRGEVARKGGGACCSRGARSPPPPLPIPFAFTPRSERMANTAHVDKDRGYMGKWGERGPHVKGGGGQTQSGAHSKKGGGVWTCDHSSQRNPSPPPLLTLPICMQRAGTQKGEQPPVHVANRGAPTGGRVPVYSLAVIFSCE